MSVKTAFESGFEKGLRAVSEKIAKDLDLDVNQVYEELTSKMQEKDAFLRAGWEGLKSLGTNAYTGARNAMKAVSSGRKTIAEQAAAGHIPVNTGANTAGFATKEMAAEAGLKPLSNLKYLFNRAKSSLTPEQAHALKMVGYGTGAAGSFGMYGLTR